MRAARLVGTAVLLAGIAAVYVEISRKLNGGTIFVPSYRDYFTLLMQGLARGHLWITGNTAVDDLVEFKGHFYLYWGPSPLLLIGPLFALGHGFQHDVAYTLVLGLASVAVFAWMIREAATSLRVPLDAPRAAWLTLLFAFASPNFYLSVQGRIWHTSQIGATLYCLLALAFAFRFINRSRFVDIALSVVCFSLAWDARMTFLAIGPVLLYAIVQAYPANPGLAVKALVMSAAVTILAIAGWVTYNYLRFGRATEMGYTYMHHSPVFMEAVRGGVLWSRKYFRRNWLYYVRKSPVDFSGRRLVFDDQGNSILWMYPWTLLTLAVPFVASRVPAGARLLFAVIAAVALVQFGAELTFYATGWAQVGARYFLDSVPLLFVLLLPVFVRTPQLVLAAALTVGVVLNTVGMFRFYGVPLF